MSGIAQTAVTWLTSDAVAARAQRSPSTVRLAAVTNALHGHQSVRDGRPVPKGKWIFHTAVVDAWLQGHDERTQRRACGCVAARRGRAS